MTTETVLVLAWLVLAHLVADFVLQTDAMVEDKRSTGRRRWRGLGTHGAIVALCLAPVVGAYGARGAILLVVVAVGHVVIDAWKVRATRHAEARALRAAHARREEPADDPADALGPAWTPVPAALFVADQLLHLLLIGVAGLV